MSRDQGLLPADAGAFDIRRATVRDGIEIAYVRDGAGGVPLLLLHGWPTTKRIFYRNITPLAEAGFDVIVPDASGWGDSPLIPGRYSDFTSSAHDFTALMKQLGFSRWVLGGFDAGSATALHMVNRFPKRVIRLLLWNAGVPHLPDDYERAGIRGDMLQEISERTDHMHEHGSDPDAFAGRFTSPEARSEYVKGFYQGRVWKPGGPTIMVAAPGSFDDESASFHAQPFENAESFRASLHYYHAMVHPELAFERPLLDRKVNTETMFLYGLEDKIVGVRSTLRAEVAFPNLVGPFLVAGGGHFLSWERPEIFNRALVCFCRDILPSVSHEPSIEVA
jgi:pimeloyl-ACP methyl ester carboxylesterase